MPRFVILTHDHPHLHWDFLLEEPGRELLRTWRLEKPPEPAQFIGAEPIADHRRVYLDYDGPISGGRGQVTRWDLGEYELLSETPSRIELRLHGRRITGKVALERQERGQWTLQLKPAKGER